MAGKEVPDDNKAILATLKSAKDAGNKFKVIFDDGKKATAAASAPAAVSSTGDMSEIVIEVEPAPVGISVKGQEVSKVTSGSQAEKLGVQLGWLVLKVNGKVMPTKDGTKAITAALGEGKKAGKKYKITFSAPAGATDTLGAIDPSASGAAASEAAAEKAKEEAEALAAETARLEKLKLTGNGQIILKYSTYTEEFDIKDGGLLAAEVDARLCLSFVMPGCTLHISDMSISERTADGQLPEDEQLFCYYPETENVKGNIEIDDEENFGQKIKQEVTSTRIEALEKDKTYHVHVSQNAEQEAKDKEATRNKYQGLAAERAMAATLAGPKMESCSCIEGNPCQDKYGCLDWNNRFDVAAKNGWKDAIGGEVARAKMGMKD